MKKHILPAIKLTVVMLFFFTVVYPLAVWGTAQLFPNGGKGDTITHNDKKYYTNIGQAFTKDEYFWSRPSDVDYDASGSGGSNKGPSNQEYLNQVEARINSFLEKNPGVTKSEIPVDLVTASGSGLDPNLSLQGAKVQVKRIALKRGIAEEKLYKLIEEQKEKPLWGLFGPEKINVLKLNIALDQLTKS